MKRIFVLYAIVLFSAVPLAQAQLSSPVLGYVVDEATSDIRIVKGIPGASVLGESVQLPLKFRKAVVSAEHDYALAVTDDTADVVLIRSLSGTPAVSNVSGVFVGGDMLALSPDGASALIYSVENSRIQIVGGLPLNPTIRFEVDPNSTGWRKLTAAAINQNGDVIAAFSDGDNGSLFLLGPEGSSRFIAAVSNVTAISFSNAGDTAVVIDRATNQVLVLQDLYSTATIVQVANSADGISDPVGVLLSRDSKNAFVVNAGSRTVTVVSVSGGASTVLDCNCEPKTLELLRGDSVFALTNRTDQPIVLFDGGSGAPRIRLVPPPQ